MNREGFVTDHGMWIYGREWSTEIKTEAAPSLFGD